MGFLKFLKKERKEDAFEDLDMPPAPPPLEGFEEGSELPDFSEEKNLGQEMPEFNYPEERFPELGKEEHMPEFPDFPEIEENKSTQFPPVTSSAVPEPSIPHEMPEPEEEETMPSPQDNYPKIAGRLFAREKRSLRERPNVKMIYVRIENFKATLGSINTVRSDLRKSEEALMKMENIKTAKDRSFDKAKSSLDDLQRKLIFVDKTLFKGE